MGEREDGGVDVMECKWNKYFAKLWVGAKDCSSTFRVLCRIFFGEGGLFMIIIS